MTADSTRAEQSDEASARRPAERADLLLELTALPVQDPGVYVHTMAETIRRGMDVDRTAVMLYDADGEALLAFGAGGELPAGATDQDGLERLSLRTPSPLARVFQAGEPYLARDVQDDAAMPRSVADAGIRSLLAVPLLVGGERRGIVYLASRRPAAFGEGDQAVLIIIAARVGLLIENAELTRRRADLEREQARQQVRKEFLGLVSHELKTPVAVIKAYTEALLHRARRDADSEGARILERVEEQANRMLSLIDDLLDLQRLESGAMALERSRFDLVALVARLAEALQQTTSAHHFAIQAVEPVMALADRRRLEQVLINLLENAIRYSPQGGDITITVQRARRPDGNADQAVVAVSDHGIGITPADLPHIFDRFYQAAGGRLHRGLRGLGVGLYIAREIVEQHGGTMWVESAEGVGSTFYLTLPLTIEGRVVA